MLSELSRKLLLGASLFTSVSLLSNVPAIAASLSQIPLSAVSVEYEQPPISTSPLTKGFQVSVADLPEVDPNLRLTSFTLVLADPTTPADSVSVGDSFRLWEGVPAPGWQGSQGIDGYTASALSPENGIAPGTTLSGFVAKNTGVSTYAFERGILRVTSVSSTAVPEPNSELLNTLALATFVGTGVMVKRKLKQQKLNERNSTI